MTDDEPFTPASGHASIRDKVVASVLRCLFLLFLGLLMLDLVGLLLPFNVLVTDPALHLLCGWAFHLMHSLPEVHWSVDMIASSAIAILLASYCLDAVARRLSAKANSTKTGWTCRTTISVVLSVVVLFGSAICGAGIVHQVSWLMRAEWITDGFSSQLFGPDANKARQLVMLAKSLGTQAGGYLPEHLKDLQNFMEEPDDIQPLLIPKTRNGEVPEPWIYLGSRLPTNAPGWLPVLVQPRPMKVRGQNLRVVFSLDGESKALNEEEYQVLLSRWRGYLQNQPTAKP